MPNLTKSDRAAEMTTTKTRLRKEIALADIRELERDEKLNQVVRVEEVRHAWTRILSEVRSAVLRIPDKCASVVMAAADVREARNILATEVEAILRSLANDVHKLAQGGDIGGGRRAGSANARLTRTVGRRAPAAKR